VQAFSGALPLLAKTGQKGNVHQLQ
jgi:hypothetical protein